MYSTYVEQLERKQINNNRNSYAMASASARVRRVSPTGSSEFLLMKDSRDSE